MSTAEKKRSHRGTILKYLDDPEWSDQGNTAIARRVSEEVGEPVDEGAVRRARKARETPPREVVDVPLDLFELDPRTQMRPAPDMDAVGHYADVIDDLDPIRAVKDVSTGRYWLAHGWHRYLAHKLEGRETIRAVVTVGTLDDAIEIAIGANADQVPRCDETKANAVRAYVALHPEETSVNKIARAARVSWCFADKVIKGEKGVTEEKPVRIKADLKPKPPARSLPPEDDEPDGGQTSHAGSVPPDSYSSRAGTPSVEPSANGHAATLPVMTEEDEFLEECHLSSKLSGDQLATFKDDALLYHRTRDTRKAFGDQFQRHAKRAHFGMPNGAYYHRMRAALSIAHPKDWLTCVLCSGGGCDSCKRRGYHIP